MLTNEPLWNDTVTTEVIGKNLTQCHIATGNSIAYLLPGIRGERPATMSHGTTFSYQFI